ncbi:MULTISPECIES: YgdI/YgdR family lipoprotein [Aeromonas]|uniref:YgdI/YgdR family lipoprotein n=1 Tax=Aeromonas TaxID=642 RepID=UPI0032EFA26C
MTELGFKQHPRSEDGEGEEAKMKRLMTILVCTLALAGCSSQYIMSTKDGRMIATDSKPKLDDSTGMYRYYDEEGREMLIKKDDVTQIMER